MSSFDLQITCMYTYIIMYVYTCICVFMCWHFQSLYSCFQTVNNIDIVLTCPRFPELKGMLPEHVQQLPKCSKLLTILEGISEYMRVVGPKRMSRRRLIQVLATRTPWELRHPDIAHAVEVKSVRKACRGVKIESLNGELFCLLAVVSET